MKLTAARDSILKTKTKALVLCFFENSSSLQGDLRKLDDTLGGALRDRLRDDFKGKAGEVLWLYPSKSVKGLGAKRVILFGLGDKKEYSTDSLRHGIYGLCNGLAKKGVTEFVLDASALAAGGVKNDQAARAAADGCLYSTYEYKKIAKKKESAPKIDKATFLFGTAADQREASSAFSMAQTVFKGVVTCRDLQNDPGNVATPTKLANVAKDIARKNKLRCKVFDNAQMKKLGMGGVLGVNRGSAEPAKFIVMEYKARKAKAPTVVLIGKGLTFDTGGISIKPAAGMDSMKMDMSGGGSVIGAMHAISILKPDVNVIGLVPSTDNMSGDMAIKPGDVLRTYGGKTIEVLNTDAEGRLILADALGYAKNYNPDAVIDLATLTGACVIALGDNVAGLMGNNDKLNKQVLAASNRTDEPFWELPLYKKYAKDLKSDVADLKNITGKRGAGSITAGLFLQEFVEGYDWVHLDIAGPAMYDAPQQIYNSRGTGFPVRTLVDFVLNYKKQA